VSRFEKELQVARDVARAAGDVLIRHYAAGAIAVETKADQSPVTAADRDANTVIVQRLRAAFPADALLSEEVPDDYEQRRGRSRVWIVDPLDGTRDFVARSGDFCVHVGLAVDGQAVVGVVARPTTGAVFYASAGGGAFVEDNAGVRALRVSSVTAVSDLRMGVSRLNASRRLSAFLKAARLEARALVMGASVKHMAVAAGALDAVVNLSPGEQEWDTCAPEVIVREAGGRFTDGDGGPFLYNQADPLHARGSIASNGACHDLLLQQLAPFVDPTRSAP
jgi:3'(2'), 5'-bisphosphate nucleotidase